VRGVEAVSKLLAVVTAAAAERIIFNGITVRNASTGLTGNGKDIPYNSRSIRNALEEIYGKENVLSTTVPPINQPNVKLAGQKHPDTNVPFDKRGYSIFDGIADFDARLPNYQNLSYTDQMKAATKQLWESIQRGEVSASKFSPEQLQQIQAGSQKIKGLTWHHHQDSGRLQLVDQDKHKMTGHIGGKGIKKDK
jgi:filamentous hemagglutinin